MDDILGSLVRRLCFPAHEDARGSLLPLEFAALPFRPQRAFVTRAAGAGTERGGHAHRTFRQLLVSLAGAVDIEVAHGDRNARVRLEGSGQALLIEPMVWSRQIFVSADAQLLVLADRPYDPAGYVDEWGDPIAPAVR
jgi:hypothetical protein